MLGAKGGDEGHILENVVFIELKRRGYDLYVGKSMIWKLILSL